MFITKEAIKDQTGYEIDNVGLNLAQWMVEAWVGKRESEVEDAGDLETLGRAVAFQAIYAKDNVGDMLEQAAVKQVAIGETVSQFDTALFAPYMSPFAVLICKRLSWVGSRSVRTGPIFAGTHRAPTWVKD